MGDSYIKRWSKRRRLKDGGILEYHATLRSATITYLPDEKRVSHVKDHINKEVPFNKIFPAIDGQNDEELKTAISNLQVSFNQKKSVRRGVLGIVLSHLTLWKFIKDSKEPFNHYLIFEDDALICENFLGKIKPLIKELPKDYDMLYLFLHPESIRRNKLEGEDFQSLQIQNKKHISKAMRTWGGVGYVISKKGAAKLYEYIKDMRDKPWDQIAPELCEKNIINAFMPKDVNFKIVDTVGFYLNPLKLKESLTEEKYKKETERSYLGTHNWTTSWIKYSDLI